ncbi:hypothetical protein SAMN04487898_117152 [Pedobacter sp. ok626]|uniref:hypothetical protein n=1 Tax=Pedobacter sp. ok626 TaxID=1761882 RepID=UPI0008802762|nr:hypothetical protein [Pedobacter sp. ok626]SDL35500.1 hypothetical protein SAMN04487898_117152 [Pedobacter sp. ok626]
MKLNILLLTPIFLYCSMPSMAQQINPDKKIKKLEVITDKNFKNGIELYGTNSANAVPISKLYPFGKTTTEPNWRLAQWGSKFDIVNVKPSVANGKVSYENQGKRISFTGMGNTALVSMEIIGSNEYPTPRKDGQDWPHLLLAQNVESRIRLTEMQSLLYTINTRLMYDVNKMGDALDEKLHTSQVSLYLNIQNVNKQSAAYGDYFWFGLPLYDYRYRDIKEYAAQDLGKEDATKKFILNVAAKDLFSGSLQDKKWVGIKKDIYPLIIKAFKKAQERGFLKDTQLTDLGIDSMNFGWEVPGTFDCGFQFKNLSLTATLK